MLLLKIETKYGRNYRNMKTRMHLQKLFHFIVNLEARDTSNKLTDIQAALSSLLKAESFYNVKYGSSIITSKVSLNISVMKT